MSRRSWIRLLFVVCLAPPLVWLCIWIYDRSSIIAWVGSIDLEVEFLITDAATGSPIEGAKIEVLRLERGFYSEEDRARDQPGFQLITDADGKVQRDCHGMMCFGTQSALRMSRDTFNTHKPNWLYRVLADGYETSELAELSEQMPPLRSQQVGFQKAKVIVPIRLLKT